MGNTVGSQIKIITPKATTACLILRAQKAIVHHDPNQSDGSNTRQFRRRPKLVAIEATGDVSPELIEAVYEANPVPVAFVGMMSNFTAPEFIAAAFTATFVNAFNTGEGLGHFDNQSKFPALQRRLKQSAVKTFNLRQTWGALANSMGVKESASSKTLPALMSFFALPDAVAYTVIGELEKNAAAYVSIAQMWHSQWKLYTRGVEYAEKAGEDIPDFEALSPKTDFATKRAMVLPIPEVSENSLRHQLRSAGREHLFAKIGMVKGQMPGWGEMSNDIIESLFYNGGNKTNASSPADAHIRGGLIQMSYPLLGLLAGTTEAFFLPEGKLRLKNWVICRENADAIQDIVPDDHPHLDVSVFDLLAEETETRRATPRGYGQMIQNAETLVEGAEIVIEYDVDYHASELERGAFVASLLTWLNDSPVLGGKRGSGKGFVGVMDLQLFETAEADLAAYEAYLAENAAALKAGLVNGTMLTDKVVV